MLFKQVKRKIEWNNLIIYTAIIAIFASFLIMPSIEVILDSYFNKIILILLKLILGTVAIIAIIFKFLSEYTNFIKSIDIKNVSYTSFRSILRKNNILAFIKTTILITPLIVFTILQGNHMTANIKYEGGFQLFNLEELGKIGDSLIIRNYEDNSKPLFYGLISTILNNNKEISFAISLLLTGFIFSLFTLTLVYAIYQISMNKFFRELKNNFNKISLNLKNKDKDVHKENFEEIVINFEREEKILLYQRFLSIESMIQYKEAEFIKISEKSVKKHAIDRVNF
ncbi:hypothetical protein [Spiroplasma diminutum]|uniref:Transmembrane protein n=1 Tax=Spiroplasma diminutum CUAS-1 TaxID=1276221 RepID=S5M004_9MOLU|nr:hypothetical protein [Spiroplasma diminutum]AGR42171.1 hypothetical protein SDIMI_v3c04670 [Spiroplasma diminutum CUAS-1]